MKKRGYQECVRVGVVEKTLMNSELLACPYCNAEVNVTEELPAGHRVLCPRCGEGFTLQQRTGQSTHVQSAPGVTSTPQKSVDPQPAPGSTGGEASLASRRLSNGGIATMILGGMFLLAMVGLTYALLTQDDRRANDKGITRKTRYALLPDKPEDRGPAQPLAPRDMVALRYLDPGVNLLLCVRVAELLEDAPGGDFLLQPLRLGKVELQLKTIEQWIGLPLKQVDHLVFGVHGTDPFPPRVSLVVRTREPYNADRIRDKLQARPLTSRGKRKRYGFELKGVQLSSMLWFADERTLVVSLEDESPDPKPLPPYKDLSQLPAPIQTILTRRMEPVAPLWLVGHARNWNEIGLIRLLENVKKQNFTPLKQIRTFALWFQFGKLAADRGDANLVLKAALHCEDAKAAQQVRDYLAGKEGKRKDLKLALDDDWLTVQWRTRLASLDEDLKR